MLRFGVGIGIGIGNGDGVHKQSGEPAGRQPWQTVPTSVFPLNRPHFEASVFCSSLCLPSIEFLSLSLSVSVSLISRQNPIIISKSASSSAMAEDTQKPAAAEEVAVEKPVAEKEKEQAPAPVPEPEAPGKPTEESAAAGVEEVAEPEKPKPVEEEKIAQSASFKEESNVVGELPDPQKKALDELKQLIQDALNKHEFTAPPPPPPPAAKEEEKAPEAPPKEKEAAAEEQVVKAEEPKTGEEEKKPAVEVESKAPESEPAAPAEVEVVVEKVATVDEDGAKTVEAIEETIVAAKPEVEEAEVTTTKKEAEVAAPSDEQTKDKEAEVPPEKVFIWGIPLLGDDRSDTILLKFLRARDFKVKDAFTMIKNTVRWRNEFGIDAVLEEDLGNDLDKVVFMHGVDKEGHPVCYNVFGEFQNKELYHNNFSDDEKRTKFLKWRIQFLEKSIRKLDFSPSGICTIVQINDLKNSPGPAKRDLRIATNQAVHLLQDNYPEFVARQVIGLILHISSTHNNHDG